MIIVGIIGPYIGGFQRLKIEYNIANAQYIGIRIANYFKETELVGFFIPHTHTARFEVLASAPEEYYHALDDAIYDSACTAGILLPEWQKSNGARRDSCRFIQQRKRLFKLKSYKETDITTLLDELEKWAHGIQNFKS